METNVEPLTFGEQLVGKTFNPSGDDKVARLKALASEMADIVRDERMRRLDAGQDSKDDGIATILFEGTIKEILTAQMLSVKYLTLKY